MFESAASSQVKSTDLTVQPDSFAFLNLCSKMPAVSKYSRASLVVFAEQPICAEIFLAEGNC